MTIKEIKSNYEKASKIVLSSMVSKDVVVETSYNTEAGTLNASLKNETEGKNGEKILVIYSVSYVEETKVVSVAAIARHIISDYFGVANTVYEPIFVDENFMVNIKQGIAAALEHSEEVIKNAEDAEKKANEEVKADSEVAPAAEEPAESTETK